MAKIKQLFLLLIMMYFFDAEAQRVVSGAERVNYYIPLLKNKSIGVIANQTSLVNNTHLVDTLLSLKMNILKIFSPEHGFRGIADAGDHVNSGIDTKTGLPIISLYGKNKKPTSDQLSEIDILVFDIQDVGVRFYTYISTLHYVMESGAENNIPVIVLDRPNPNGHYIDGPILEGKYKSFVGMHPVPIVYGMTIGEYAKMINGEKWIDSECDLLVVELENYTRETHYDLPIKPSPNLPNSKSINLYPSLCLFEGTNVSVGRGTPYPFQHFGSPFLNSTYYFIPRSGDGSKYPKHENKKCFGTDLRFQDNYLTELNLDWLIYAYHKTDDKKSFFNDFFDNLAGTDKLRNQILSGMDEKEIKKTWEEGLKDFIKKRKRHLLYR